MNPITYGYARVSSHDQNPERQLIALNAFGIEPKRIYCDAQSGKDFDRPKYKALMRKLKKGDTLVVKSIDRLGRNYEEIIGQWKTITRKIQASIVVLDMPLLDTRREQDLTGTLIADIVLQLLSYVAQTEREFIHQRQAEGIAAAKARGIRFGAMPKERPGAYGDCLQQWRDGSLSARAAARELHISHKTFLRWANSEKDGTQGRLWYPPSSAV